jgi:hypothetical protein
MPSKLLLFVLMQEQIIAAKVVRRLKWLPSTATGECDFKKSSVLLCRLRLTGVEVLRLGKHKFPTPVLFLEFQ